MRPLVWVVVGMLGCSHELEGFTIDPAPALELAPASHVMAVGDTLQLVLLADDEAGPVPVEDDPSWRSSSEDAVTIDDDGLATAAAPGIVTISATLQTIVSRSTVMVVAHPVESVAMSPATPIELAQGETAALAAIATLTAPAGEPSTADVSAATIWSSDSDAVEVDDTGGIRRVGVGDAQITATVGTFSASAMVTTR